MKFERIVQITDTHIVDDYSNSVLSWDPVEALEEVISSINSLTVKPSLILVTGDLVHDGSVESYRVLEKVLARIELPIYVITGNHDSVKNIKTSLLGQHIVMVESKIVESINWAVVFLDTTVPKQEHGNISSETLTELKQTYDSLHGKHYLVAMHHSPTPECLAPACQLLGREQLLKFLSQHGNIKAVISGHTHYQTESEHQGIKLLTTPSTLFEAIHS